MQEFYKTLFNPSGKFRVWVVAGLVLLGAALMIIPPLFTKKQGNLPSGAVASGINTLSGDSSLSEKEKILAEKIASILTQVQGAGKVSVSVSIEAGPEKEFARNTSTDKSRVEEKESGGTNRVTDGNNDKSEVVFAQGKSDPVVVKEIAPQIKGVLVVAEGATDADVKAKINRALQALLDLPANRIMVLPKESR